MSQPDPDYPFHDPSNSIAIARTIFPSIFTVSRFRDIYRAGGVSGRLLTLYHPAFNPSRDRSILETGVSI